MLVLTLRFVFFNTDVGLEENPDNIASCNIRKRLRQPSILKQATAKSYRNSGMSYIDKRGKTIEVKKFINIDCNCKR